MPTLAHAGAPGYAPARSVVPTIVATFQLSPFESLVATLSERAGGRRTAAISRIKRTPSGKMRRMAVLEFGEHRAIAIASLVDELLRAINDRRAP